MSAYMKKIAISAIAASAALASPAMAQQSPNFMMTWFTTADDTGPITYDPAREGKAAANGDGTWNYTGSLVGLEWDFGWDCTVLPGSQGFMGGGGAFVDAGIVVTNNSASTQTFSVLMSLGTSINGPTSLAGNVAATVVANEFGVTATLGAPSGGSVYAGFIDLNDPMVDLPAATLLDDSYALSATGFVPNSDSDSFSGGVGGTVNSNIALLLTFTLTAGATATVTGVFSVVPAPATVALLSMLGFTGSRRRRD